MGNYEIPKFIEKLQEYDIDTIIAGEARGFDEMAKTYAAVYKINYEGYPADWNKYGRRAGYVRNRQMLEEGKPDLVIAFPGGKGTAMMVEIAKKAGVKVDESL